jgi:hypothetical protein
MLIHKQEIIENAEIFYGISAEYKSLHVILKELKITHDKYTRDTVKYYLLIY